jgi:hypothetical protein
MTKKICFQHSSINITLHARKIKCTKLIKSQRKIPVNTGKIKSVTFMRRHKLITSKCPYYRRTRNLPGGTARLVGKADNLTTICEWTV